jgi:hypothetical protein
MTRVRQIKSDVMGALAGAGTWLINAGRQIIQGLINGIQEKIGAVTAKLRELTSLIPASKGPPKKDEVLLRENGQLIMEGLISGIASRVGLLQAELGDITNAVPGMVGPKVMNVNSPPATYDTKGAVSGPSYTKNIYQDVRNYNPTVKPDSLQINEDLQMAAALLEV